MEDEDVEGTPGSSGSRPEAGRDGEEVSAISRAPKCARQYHTLRLLSPRLK